MEDDYNLKAQLCSEAFVPVMQELRQVIDELENVVAKKYWDLPTYFDMLYSVKD